MIMSYFHAACEQIEVPEGCLRKEYHVFPSCAYGLVRSCLKLFGALLQSNNRVISADQEQEYKSRKGLAYIVGHINEDEISFQKVELLFSFALIWSFGAVLKHKHRWRFNSWLQAFWSQEHGSRESTMVQIAVARNGAMVRVKGVYPETESVFDWLPVLIGSEDYDALQGTPSSGSAYSMHAASSGDGQEVGGAAVSSMGNSKVKRADKHFKIRISWVLMLRLSFIHGVYWLQITQRCLSACLLKWNTMEP